MKRSDANPLSPLLMWVQSSIAQYEWGLLHYVAVTGWRSILQTFLKRSTQAFALIYLAALTHELGHLFPSLGTGIIYFTYGIPCAASSLTGILPNLGGFLSAMWLLPLSIHYLQRRSILFAASFPLFGFHLFRGVVEFLGLNIRSLSQVIGWLP